eukprot:gnl/MRDRNA2_/MRDRNA2_28576_c0_seq1.p1 gnl/MRDRNA2_/MRDRNA2_28576_c0~~gnl/MRDRNA2_/MRDRNA2_28576_c0_seq1.p1  ORF type:complete len:1130 (+),score=172.37 gnl/MRDRNA2_/MRDRNA2_28576_c0_seq1:337-3390(+)
MEDEEQHADVEIFPILDELWPSSPEKKIPATTQSPVLLSSDSISELKVSVNGSSNATHKTYENEHVFYKIDESKSMQPGLEMHELDFNGGCSNAINKVVKILKVNKAALDSPDGKAFLKDLGTRGDGMLKMCQRIVNFFSTKDVIESHEILTVDDISALVACETGQKSAKIEEPQVKLPDVVFVQGDMAECSIEYPPNAVNGLSQVKGKDTPANQSSNIYSSLAQLYDGSETVTMLDAVSKGVAVTWLDGKISYCFHTSVDDVTKSAFRIAVQRITSVIPCIYIREIEVSPSNADTCESLPSIIVRSDNEGCWSYVGQVSKKAGCMPKSFATLSQTLNLGKGCGFVGSTEHQIGHSLGLTHEYTRHDRDRYIHFKKEHTNKDKFDQQFPIGETDYNETKYDFLSIMHPGAFLFSVDGMETIVPRDLKITRNMGQREGFSQYDIEHLAELYGCLHQANIGLTNVALEDALNTPPDEAHCEDSFPSGIASVNTGDDIPCPDLEKRCNHADVGIMVRMACPHTCQVCWHPTSTAAPTMTNTGNKWHCEDSLDNPDSGSYGAKMHGEKQCPGLKKYCESHLDVRLKCQKTCDNCPRCQDSVPGYQIMMNGVQKEATCKELADVGKCKDKSYGNDITAKCPAACGLCVPTGAKEADKPCHDTANTHLTIDDKPATCMQLEPYCNSDGWGQEIRDLCPQTCKVACVGSQEANAADCQDQWDSGFKLSSGHMASCKTLGHMKMCYSKQYGSRIRQNCPATCRVCHKHGGLGHLKGCTDTPDTGVALFNKPANCEDLAIFCQHPNEVTDNFADLLLDIQRICPKTCNTCSATDPYMKNIGTGGISRPGCVDMGPVRNAIGNDQSGPMSLSCEQVAKYQWCDHFSNYEKKPMHEICPASCNSCADDAARTKSSCFDHEDTQFYFDASETAAACHDLQSYCAHPEHGPQVREKCCKMCSDCADEPDKLGLKIYNMLGQLQPATCPDLEQYCHQNNTHQDTIMERCASTCKTCFNRRRRSRRVTVIGY